MDKGTQIQPSFVPIYEWIQDTQISTLQTVNQKLIGLYWRIGAYLYEKTISEAWGKSTVRNLANYLEAQDPTLKGFTTRNLWRMKQFYEAYHAFPKVSPLVTLLTWTNNLIILSKTKTIEERTFYLQLAINERYSKRELERQINSSVFERTLLSDAKLPPSVKTLPQHVASVFKDTYVFEFLDLPQAHNEKTLKKALVANLKHFLLELGRDFTFIGEEFRLQVGNNDFFIDLLFYHRELQCLVAMEMKMQAFEPSFLGQLNFYLEALDSDIKKPHENPSIGILLCKGKDDEVVEYALRRNISPTLIADYETKLINKKILRQKLHELILTFEKDN
jgi:predicted nuclease of restriction endonuclease-like (RecB) superfamily